MNIKLKLIGACAVIGVFAATPASAEWIQSLGIGQKTTNIGGAGVASASDYDVFYTNPAGAANITTPTIGVGVRVLNTTNLDNAETGFNHGADDTLTGSDNAYVPSLGIYLPGLIPNVTLGVGLGIPAALGANWGSEQPNEFSLNGVIGTVNAATGATAAGQNANGVRHVELIVGELTPTIGIKLSDKLNVGASLGITTLKHLKAELGVFVPAAVVSVLTAAAFNAPAVATLKVNTPTDVGLPIPPWEFATSPHEASFTLGMQYQLLPNVSIGGVFRSESPTEYDVDLALNLGPLGTEFGVGHLKLEIPRHVQIGATVDLMPGLKVSGDVKWTNWANATGVGSPLVVQIDANANNTVIGGLVRQLVAAPNNGDDTYSFHLGVQYKILPNLELQAGYAYDPAVFDKANLSYLQYSADRNIYSLGATLELPDSVLLGSSGTWEWTIGGQLVDYEDITVAAGQSQTFGLNVGSITAGVLTDSTVGFSPNGNAFEVGGYIWSVGLSGVYKFGAPEEVALK